MGLSLPILQAEDKQLNTMQTKWASILNPLLSNPSVNSVILQRVPLTNGTNSINHTLGRKLQGWRIVRRRQFLVTGTPTAYDIYDVQDSNQYPDLTLKLTCNQGTGTNPVLVDLEVF